MHLPQFLVYSLTIAGQFKYGLIFIGTVIEGPILMLATGFFLRFGVFSLLPLYVSLVAGDLAADIGWYFLGYYFADPLIQKHGKFLGVTPEVFERVKKMLNENQTKILLGSKLTIGFGLALGVVIVAGATHIPFKKYLLLNTIGEMVLVAIMLSIGYFLGHLSTYVADGFKWLFIGAGIVTIGAAGYGFSRYIKSRTLTQ